jgi:hypothetical protein
MLPSEYFAELVASSLTMRASGTAKAVGISTFAHSTSMALQLRPQKHTRKIVAEVLKIFLELHSFLMIEEV